MPHATGARASTGHPLDVHGIRPRSEDGLVGVAVAPLLHFGFEHLASNTVPALVLGFLTLATGESRADSPPPRVLTTRRAELGTTY